MKCLKAVQQADDDRVTLCVRVWIEIFAPALMTRGVTVTLCVRVWIEMPVA